MRVDLFNGDCLDYLRLFVADNSVDSIVTDPPYGLSFMSKKWDYDVPSVEVWAECLRVLKPGGHLLAFAGTRTQHRMAVRIEDAGFEIRDMIAWVYGSGFPKSLDVSKAIDKAAGAEREVLSSGKAVKRMIPGADQNATGSWIKDNGREYVPTVTAAATEDAARWQGWGTALKPALEPITVARKPLAGTVAANVQAHSTGALNIDACRVAVDLQADASQLRTMARNQRVTADGWGMSTVSSDTPQVVRPDGRWPANLIHDGSDEVLAAFPQAPGQLAKASTSDTQRAGQNTYGVMARGSNGAEPRADGGSAARFFYCAKASRKDRGADNNHPTVKPTELMAYLCRLVTPPGGVVLDPFMGSGSTGKAAVREGFQFIGVEREVEYLALAAARIAEVAP
ncbi:site-specific DNA-methyltransferase [Comamonas antarctica]|uniref:DNA-methyltransferase n=1 Tax=Comamonas antarctica TaxID=2743470 RepID=UPI0028EB2839|nr:site-specific DNA-methyltransferase [Comamonas antarctica]